MQTLRLDIPDNKVDTVLNIIKNLKNDLITNFELVDKNIEDDPYFHERKEHLQHLYGRIISGEESSYDFDISINELLLELEK